MKRSQIQWIILGIIAIVAIVILIIKTIPSEQPSTNITETNITETTNLGTEFGDLVTINYVLTLPNGTVADTNNEQIAKENGLMNYVKGPYTFILGQSGKIKGFDEAITGMQIGDKRNTIIEPSEKELIMVVNKTKSQRRHVQINRNQAFPTTAYENLFNKEPKLNDIIKSDDIPFTYKVMNITNTTVIAKMQLKEGEKYILPNTEWNSTVFEVTEEDAIFYQTPIENQTLDTPLGLATITLTKSTMSINYEPEVGILFNRSLEISPGFSIPSQFQVIAKTDEAFTIQRYGLLTDKRLNIEVELLNVTEDVKEVKVKRKELVETVTA